MPACLLWSQLKHINFNITSTFNCASAPNQMHSFTISLKLPSLIIQIKQGDRGDPGMMGNPGVPGQQGLDVSLQANHPIDMDLV